MVVNYVKRLLLVLVSCVILIILAIPIVHGNYETYYDLDNVTKNPMALQSDDVDVDFDYLQESSTIISGSDTFEWIRLSGDHVIVTENGFVNETYLVMLNNGVPEFYGLTGDWHAQIHGKCITVTDSFGSSHQWFFSEYVIYPSISGDYTQYTVNESHIKYYVSDFYQIYGMYYLEEDRLISVNGESIVVNSTEASGDVTYVAKNFRDANGKTLNSYKSSITVSIDGEEDVNLTTIFIPTKVTITRFIYGNGIIDIGIFVIAAISLVCANYVLAIKSLRDNK